jgi:ribosomal protein L37AE/L43A
MRFGIIHELFDNLSEEERLYNLIELYNEMKVAPTKFCEAVQAEIQDISEKYWLCSKCGDTLIGYAVKERHDREDPTKTESIIQAYCQNCDKTLELRRK